MVRVLLLATLLSGCIIIPIPLSGDDESGEHDELVELHVRCVELQDPESCRIAGRIYEDGAGPEVDRGRAVSYYDEACRIGSSAGCEDARRIRAGE